MIIHELVSEEKAFFDGELYIAVPFCVRFSPDSDEGERISAEVYPSLKYIAEEFASLFGGDEESCFSDAAIGWAEERVGAFLAEHGYSVSEDSDTHYLKFLADRADEGMILGSTVRLSDKKKLKNLTEYDTNALAELGYICFVSEVDGEIVSLAASNIPAEDMVPGEPVEIGVETSPMHRGRGYGASNTAALINALSSMGISALYECDAKNIPSALLIQKLGGVMMEKLFYIVGIQDGE